MKTENVIDALETIAIGSVAITNAALDEAGGGALSFEQWRAILVLGEAEDGRRISDLARHVGVTLPATSRLLQRLARRGLVSLSTDPRDARATICRLTGEGSALRRVVLRARRERLRAIVARAGIDAEANDVLAQLARSFAEAS